jgi:hypothetical protein
LAIFGKLWLVVDGQGTPVGHQADIGSCFHHEYRPFSTINERLQFINQSIAVLLENLRLQIAILDNK